MKDIKRLFCAIQITPTNALNEAIEQFSTIQDYGLVTWVSPHDLHVTIQFFGNTPNTQVSQLLRALKATATHCNPFEIDINGCGSFWGTKMNSVLWFGVSPNKDLHELYNNMAFNLTQERFPCEGKQFIPHLTFARIRKVNSEKNIERLLEKNKKVPFVKLFRFMSGKGQKH